MTWRRLSCSDRHVNAAARAAGGPGRPWPAPSGEVPPGDGADARPTTPSLRGDNSTRHAAFGPTGPERLATDQRARARARLSDHERSRTPGLDGPASTD